MNIIVTSIGIIAATYAASLAIIPLTPNTFYIVAIALLVAVFLLGLLLGLLINQKNRSSKAAGEEPNVNVTTEEPPQSMREDSQTTNESMQEYNSDQRPYDSRNRSRYYW